MANNYFNFTLPFFSTQYGTDWEDFSTIINDNVDNIMKKTYQLYWLNDINSFTTRVSELVLDSLGIEYSSTDTLLTKKIKIRTFVTKYANKGLADTYLDIGEDIVGTSGTIYTSLSTLNWLWGTSRWGSTGDTNNDSIKWCNQPRFYIYIDVDTTDNDELDQIQLIMEQDSLLPAFYRIFLIDSSFTILRIIQ